MLISDYEITFSLLQHLHFYLPNPRYLELLVTHRSITAMIGTDADKFIYI